MDEDLEMVTITAFNEWAANIQVEPSREEGFAYLEVIRDHLSAAKAS